MDVSRSPLGRLCGLVCALVASAAAPRASAQAPASPQLYWSQYVYDSPVDRFSLHRSSLDGTQAVELNHGVSPEPYLGMAVYDGKLVWGADDGTLHAATLAGEELGPWQAPLPPAVRAEALGMVYDALTGATFRAGQAAGGERNIERVDANGTVTTLIPTDLFPANLALALDSAGEHEAAAEQAGRVRGRPRPALMLVRARAACSAGDGQGALDALDSLDEAQWGDRPELARRRWSLAGYAERRTALTQTTSMPAGDPWPQGFEPDVCDLRVGGSIGGDGRGRAEQERGGQ